jgi:hypothetical protein
LAATSGTCAAVGFPCPSSSGSLGIAVARSNSGENISVGAWPPLPAAALLVVLGLLLLTLLTAPSCHTEGAGVTEIGIQLTAGVVACFVTVAQTNRAGSREGWVNSSCRGVAGNLLVGTPDGRIPECSVRPGVQGIDNLLQDVY